MQQVLVYDEADFFTKWEVFSATNLDQALTLASKSSPKNLSEASQLFASIRKLAQKTDVTKLAVNNAVRNRLTNITKLAPNHVSSQILLLQGSGKRPMRLSKKALAHELLPVIEKIRNRLKNDINPEHASVSALKTYHENARDDLSKFERLVDRSNDDLYQESIKLANELRRMMLLARRASDYDERRDDNIRKLRSHYYDTYRECETLLNKTRVAAGFPPKAKKEEK